MTIYWKNQQKLLKKFVEEVKRGEIKMKDTDWIILNELYKEPNLTKVSEKLYYSQPSLTKIIQNIEEEF